jgi:hypothetical protein
MATLGMALATVAMICTALLLPDRRKTVAAVEMSALSAIPLLVGFGMLAQWQRIASAWFGSVHACSPAAEQTGRLIGPHRLLKWAGARFEGLAIAVIGVVFSAYALVWLIRDLAW